MNAGTVVFWKNFVFPSGSTADKLILVLSDIKDGIFLVLYATSKGRPPYRTKLPGCHADKGWYFINSGSEFFDLDTWVILDDPVEITAAQFVQAAMQSGDAKTIGQLSTQLLQALRNCLKKSADVSQAQLNYLE